MIPVDSLNLLKPSWPCKLSIDSNRMTSCMDCLAVSAISVFCETGILVLWALQALLICRFIDSGSEFGPKKWALIYHHCIL